jgi:hypothetical protein
MCQHIIRREYLLPVIRHFGLLQEVSKNRIRMEIIRKVVWLFFWILLIGSVALAIAGTLFDPISFSWLLLLVCCFTLWKLWQWIHTPNKFDRECDDIAQEATQMLLEMGYTPIFRGKQLREQRGQSD